MSTSDHRRLVLKGLGLSVASTLTTIACGGGGGGADGSVAAGMGGATGSSSSSSGGGASGSSSSSSSGGASSSSGGGATVDAVTPSLFPSNGTAQFFAASGTGASNAPFCIGQAFRQGEMPSGSGIVANIGEFQATVKNRWPDGSAKFAILAGRLSLDAGVSKAVVLSKGTAGTAQALTEADLIAANPDVVLQFGTGSVRLRDLLGTASTYNGSTRTWSPGRAKTWISGPQMSSWLYRAHIGNSAHLVAWFEVRVWKGGAVQVLPWIENGYLKVGNPTAQSGVAKLLVNGAVQFSWDFSGTGALPHHCRAPLVDTHCKPYWLGIAAPDLSTIHDTVYLQQTRLVPAYYAAASSFSPSLVNCPRAYAPLGRLNYPADMPGTGYAPSIGLIPEWDALYLSSGGDIRAQQGVLAHAMSAGRYAIHYRDETTGEPLLFSSYPNLVVADGNASITGVGDSPSGEYTPLPTGLGAPLWDLAHSPSLGFMAYLLSGHCYFMEETQFAATINYLHHHASYRHGAKGICETGHMTVRGAAWAIRTLAQAACISEDGTPLKNEFVRSLDENVKFYWSTFAGNATFTPLGITGTYGDFYAKGDGYNTGEFEHPTWMEDFMTATLGYAYTLQVAGTTAVQATHDALCQWKFRSVVGRLAAVDDPTGSPFVDAGRYFFAISPESNDWSPASTGPWYNWRQAWEATRRTQAILDGNANNVIHKAPGNALRGGYFPEPTSYWGNLMPAIAYAVDMGAAGAAEAYARLTGADNWLELTDAFNDAPVWAIRPINASRGVGYVYAGKRDESAMPAWRQGQAVNAWREIAGSSMSRLPKPAASLIALSYGGPNGKLEAWNSVALDTRNSTVYCAANGGHMDYAGNEVNSIGLMEDAPKWIERTAPTPADKIIVDSPYYADGTPSSRHSYYAHFFIEKRNRAMHLYNGVPFGTGRGGGWVVDGFNPTTNKWDLRASYPTANIGELALGSAMTLDPRTGDVYAFPNDGYSVWRWNQESNAWSRLANTLSNFHSYYAASAFDTKRGRILLMGGGVPNNFGRDGGVVYDIASKTMTAVTLSGSGAGALAALPGLTGSIGLVYAPELDAYVVGSETSDNGGMSVFTIDANSFNVQGLNTGASGNGIPFANYRIFNRFLWVPQLGGIVFCPTYLGNTWFLRLV